MSYYDFDDHFWSPKLVCIQSKSVDTESSSLGIKITNILFIIFVTFSAGLLIKLFMTFSNIQLNQSKLNTATFSNNCLMLKTDSIKQIYCSPLSSEN
ncbi:hypothetical protein LC593_21950 [Nostoc sp. CHAB 5844]|nr:hypothetical protein [Nostoc sp. CHAB 5844]